MTGALMAALCLTESLLSDVRVHQNRRKPSVTELWQNSVSMQFIMWNALVGDEMDAVENKWKMHFRAFLSLFTLFYEEQVSA